MAETCYHLFQLRTGLCCPKKEEALQYASTSTKESPTTGLVCVMSVA